MLAQAELVFEDEKKIILHESGDYWVSNEGSKAKPNYHVWKPRLTHAVCDSAYDQFSLAIARCDYLDKGTLTS